MDPILALIPERPQMMEAVVFLLAGQLYVIAVLGALALVCAALGKLFVAREAKAQAQVVAAAVAAAVGTVLDTRQPAAPAVQQAQDEVTPELAAVVAAAVATLVERPHRVVSMRPAGDSGWAREGRRDIFSSHRVR